MATVDKLMFILGLHNFREKNQYKHESWFFLSSRFDVIVYRAAQFGPKFIYQYDKTITIIIIIKAFILVENSRKPLKLVFIRSSHYNWQMLCSQIHVISDPK